jgi:DNA excision repair protein ERCC-4
MRILVDTREQAPFTFQGYEVAPEPATLPVGDYSLPGFTDRVTIERKELNDLVSCLMNSNRDRFERELARGRHYDLFAMVVEANLADVSQGRYRSDMKPQAALQSIITFQVRYRLSIVWAGNRKGAEYVTHSLLSKYLREIGERYHAATVAQGPIGARKNDT